MRSLKIFFVLVVILAGAVSAYVAYDPYRPQEDEVFELNLSALAVGGGEGEDEGEGEGGQGEGGEGGDQGEGGEGGEGAEGGLPTPPNEDGWTRGSCQSCGGNWNMATSVFKSENVSTTCTVSGKISILGIELSGSYEKGNTYQFTIVTYHCVASDGNCCIKMGAYCGDMKIS